jgi:hypothetical protein
MYKKILFSAAAIMAAADNQVVTDLSKSNTDIEQASMSNFKQDLRKLGFITRSRLRLCKDKTINEIRSSSSNEKKIEACMKFQWLANKHLEFLQGRGVCMSLITRILNTKQSLGLLKSIKDVEKFVDFIDELCLATSIEGFNYVHSIFGDPEGELNYDLEAYKKYESSAMSFLFICDAYLSNIKSSTD